MIPTRKLAAHRLELESQADKPRSIIIVHILAGADLVLPARSTRCPYCRAPQPPMVEGASAVCAYCGSSFVMTPQVCPRCGTFNTEDAEACIDCGEPLTTVGRVFQRHEDARRPPQFLQYARQEAPTIKRAEAEASRRRSDTFSTQEAHRIEALRTQRAEQAAKDRMLLMVGLVFIAGLILLVGSVAIIRWLVP